MSRLRIRGARVLDPASGLDDVACVDVTDGRIVAVGPEAPGAVDEVVEAEGHWLAPGFVDLHTHLREPGQEYKEDIASGTIAAAAGGYTTVCCMANTEPVNDTPAITEFIHRQAQTTGRVRVHVIGAATQGLNGQVMSEMADLAAAGAVAFSDDGAVIMNTGVMRRVLEYAGGVGRPVVAHCEDLDLRGPGVVNEGPHATCCGLPGSPAEAETVMVARDVELAALTGAHLHIAHVSAAGSVDHIRAAKDAGVRVTAEVTPHHLALTDERIRGYDTCAKMAPPLRSARDREALIEGLRDGTIDCVATDHAPHAEHEKDLDFIDAPFGVIGLETALPVVMELVHAGQLTPLEAIQRMATQPARVFGLRAGTLEPGAPADLALIDPELVWKVDRSHLSSRSHNSAFLGSELRGRVVRTWVGGCVAHEHGASPEASRAQGHGK